uniref:Aldehyde dehydrogenase 16 family, member A1 n=1 Tax=Tetraodon nigroviridis TaxID=99883 RepID=H3D0P4_TETNG
IIMASGNIKTVYDIFQSMESGPTSTPTYPNAQAWLDHHSRSLGLFINGKFVLPADRQSCSLTDSSGSVICSTVCAEDDDISQCASSAADGYQVWSELTCRQRADVLLRLVGIVGQHGQCVSELCGLCGASCSPSTVVRLLQYYGSWAQLRDAFIGGWKPLGVVAVVVSDDCSFYSLLLKVIPALAMGNSVVVVPGRAKAPPCLLLAQLVLAAGLPAGALNVLTGSDSSLGAKVAQNPSISYVTYSGNKNGALLCEAAAGWGIPVSVSVCVGSSCPFIVFDTADIDSAVDGLIEAAFRTKTDVHWVLCVQERVVESVLARLRLRMAGLKCLALSGDEDRLLVDAAVQEAQQQGATLIQSCTPPSSGAQYPPTVLCKSAPSSPFVVSPPPGPLLPLLAFRSSNEAVALGNHTPHGQAASIWTEDLTLALETAKSLSVGAVWVNSYSVFDPCLPMSGHRDSGTCTDGGQEGLYQFLRAPSFASSHPRSSPISLDYAKFGSGALTAVIPDDPGASLIIHSFLRPKTSPLSAPKHYLQFVGGKPCKSVSGGSVAVEAPGGGGVLGYCPEGGRKDVRNAVEAASKVQPGWMKKSPSARAQSLNSLAKGLDARRRDLAASVSAQTGVSLDEAEKEVELSIVRLGDWAAYCDKLKGGSLPMPQSGFAISVPEAVGVVGVLLPDNNPLYSLVTLLGAAVATGNAVIIVPSQKYPLPALLFIQVLQACDLPAGLVSILTGRRDQLTAALANHSVIKALWYWGSPE